MPRLSPTEKTFRESGLPSDVIRVVNPNDFDFDFTYKNEVNIFVKYMIASGEEKQWPRYLACHYTKHMIDKLIVDQIVLPNDPWEKSQKGNKDAVLPTSINDAVRREQLFDLLVIEIIQTDLGEAMPPEEQSAGDGDAAAGELGLPQGDPDRDYAGEIKQIAKDPGQEAIEDKVENKPVKAPPAPKKPTVKAKAKPLTRRTAGKANSKK